LEVAIAAEALGVGPLAVDKVMGFTFGLHDDDDGGDWESYLIWEGTRTNDSSAEYGVLILESALLAPASLGGFVWNDSDANGIQGATESGIPGVILNLYDSANNLIALTSTDANGFYSFRELSPGTYTVTAITPPGYVPTTPTSLVRTLESGEEELTVGFGFIPPTAVMLVSFKAEARPEGVVITWRTLSEEGITGFHLLRALTQFGPWEEVTDEPIPARGMSGVGATYQVVDADVQSGFTYHYRLVTIPDEQGYGPIRVWMYVP